MATDTYTVVGMTCDHCVRAVTQELRKLTGVTNVEVDLDTGNATVESADRIDHAVIATAVADAGYELES